MAALADSIIVTGRTPCGALTLFVPAASVSEFLESVDPDGE